MDDMEMRFLTTRRHHEELQEFQAASQQNRGTILIDATDFTRAETIRGQVYRLSEWLIHSLIDWFVLIDWSIDLY